MNDLLKLAIGLFIILWSTSPLESQDSYFELGVGVGAANYSGDISPSGIGKILGTSRLAGTALLRYNLNSYFNVKLSGTIAKLEGRDSYSDKAWQIERNLSFFTNIYEIGLSGEINLFQYAPLDREKIFTVYLTGGIAGFHFNPLAELDGQIYELQTLGTEGQGLSEYPDRQFYKLYDLSFPFGGGIKFKIDESLNFNMEMAWRFTRTDYLDDVSKTYPDYNILLENRGLIAANLSNRTGEILGEPRVFGESSSRGGETVNDYYFLLTVGLSYNLVNYGSNGGYNKVRRRKTKTSKCPRF